LNQFEAQMKSYELIKKAEKKKKKREKNMKKGQGHCSGLEPEMSPRPI
jgi:hypothetical protein